MTEAAAKTFAEISRDVVNNFIQTVIMVDDRAFDSIVVDKGPNLTEPLVEPSDPTATEEEQAIAASDISTLESSASDALGVSGHASQPGGDSVIADPTVDAEVLDAQTAIKIFAKRGLICAVLQPAADDDLLEEMTAASKRADIVVVDWVIHGDHGQKTCSLISAVAKLDSERAGRLRLIAIYTGTPDLRHIVEQVRRNLSEAGLDGFNVDPSGLALSSAKSTLRVVALAKRDTPIQKEDHELNARVVRIEDLPERLCREFAEMTRGLLSNVALRGLSVLRDNTHVLLAHINQGLDSALLGHRILLPNPDEVGEHAVEIVASEITSLLHAFEVGSSLDDQTIEAWVRHHFSEPLELSFDKASNNKKIKVTIDTLLELAQSGIGKWKSHGLSNKDWKTAQDHLSKNPTEVFANNREAASHADHEFAVATSLIRRYGDAEPAPRLNLGTIVRNMSDEASLFRICIQPRCDSVRIPPEGRSFLFIEAVETTFETSRFDLVILDSVGDRPKYRKLKIIYKPYQASLISFLPTGESEVVRAEQRPEGYILKPEGSNGQFRWVGQLKDAQAQRISNNFAAQLSRVGLNESEWLRRWAQEK